MKFDLFNINNITNYNLSLTENALNIRFGNNGTGKSTIGKAIYFTIAKLNDQLDLLKPFGSSAKPKVINFERIRKCILFNSDFVSDHLYLDNNLLDNGFDIILKDSEYEENKNALDELLKDLYNCLNNKYITQFVTDVSNLHKEILFNEDGNLKNSTKFGRGIKNKVNLDDSLPKSIEKYNQFFLSTISGEWLKWFENGHNKFENINHDVCPYCLKPLTDEDKTNINTLLDAIDSKTVIDNRHSRELLSVLGDFTLFSDDIDNIKKLTRKVNGEEAFKISEILRLLKNESDKINKASHIDANNLYKKIKSNTLEEDIDSCKIDISKFNADRKDLIKAFSEFNNALDSVKKQYDKLKFSLIQYSALVKKSVSYVKNYFNDFLKIAGMKYKIETDIENDKSFLLLKPLDEDNPINARSHLSYGELNALSLLLFSITARSFSGGLIILDDPVSSFDSNKRFAILHSLFSLKRSPLRNRTVLLLTHDFSTVIDTILLNKYGGNNSNAYFLMNKNGLIVEKQITQNMIMSTYKIEETMVLDESLSIVARLSHLRRLFELKSNKNEEYDILSCLFHLKNKIDRKIDETNFIDLNEEEINNGLNGIRRYIPDFDYNRYLNLFKDNDFIKQEYIKSSNMDKLSICRIYIKNNSPTNVNKVTLNFINDSYHIENMLIYGINDSEFDNVPPYIIQICDSIMKISKK